jgi:hypothetical protein
MMLVKMHREIIRRIGTTTAKNTQNLLSPGRNCPPIDKMPDIIEIGTNRVARTVRWPAERACEFDV